MLDIGRRTPNKRQRADGIRKRTQGRAGASKLQNPASNLQAAGQPGATRAAKEARDGWSRQVAKSGVEFASCGVARGEQSSQGRAERPGMDGADNLCMYIKVELTYVYTFIENIHFALPKRGNLHYIH